jgi:aspartate/methionine/tyrosine aminotransferase
MVGLSSRSASITPQPMFRILAEAAVVERAGQRVVHLEIGDTTGYRNDAIVELLRQESLEPPLGYAPSAGLHELRVAFAELYSREKGVAFAEDAVVIAPANALVTQLLAVLCDPGDAVLVPDPGFPTYRLACRFNGLRAVPYPLGEAAAWNPDVDAFLAALETREIAAAILNVPSNPLGTVMDAAVARALVDALRERNVPCILDETYKNLVYDGTQPALPHGENLFYLYSLSKDAAAPGLRIGCAVGAPHVIGKVADYNSLLLSCLPPLLQRVAARYLTGGRDFAATLRAEIPARIDAVDEILRSQPLLTYVRPNAAFYVFLNVSASGRDADAFANELLHTRGVCVCPGTAFGERGSEYVRVTLAGPEDELYAGCEQLAAFVSRAAESPAMEAVAR